MSSPSTYSFESSPLATLPVPPARRDASELSGKDEATRHRLLDAWAALIIWSGFEGVCP